MVSGRHQGGITETETHIKVTFHSDQGGKSKSFSITKVFKLIIKVV